MFFELTLIYEKTEFTAVVFITRTYLPTNIQLNMVNHRYSVHVIIFEFRVCKACRRTVHSAGTAALESQHPLLANAAETPLLLFLWIQHIFSPFVTLCTPFFKWITGHMQHLG